LDKEQKLLYPQLSHVWHVNR